MAVLTCLAAAAGFMVSEWRPPSAVRYEEAQYAGMQPRWAAAGYCCLQMRWLAGLAAAEMGTGRGGEGRGLVPWVSCVSATAQSAC